MSSSGVRGKLDPTKLQECAARSPAAGPGLCQPLHARRLSLEESVAPKNSLLSAGLPSSQMADAAAPPKNNPSDFLKTVIGRPVVVKLNSGVDYRGESTHIYIAVSFFGVLL